MKPLLSLTLGLLSTIALPFAASASDTLLLNLKFKEDNSTVQEIKVFGSEINPNVFSTDANYTIKIDDQAISLPDEFHWRLQSLRRNFSYDSLSGGIQDADPSYSAPICMLGGPARGLVLEARYLTFQRPGYSIAKQEMRPVFSMPQNCLFTEQYQPTNPLAKENARIVTELLNMLVLLGYQER